MSGPLHICIGVFVVESGVLSLRDTVGVSERVQLAGGFAHALSLHQPIHARHQPVTHGTELRL